MPSRSIPGWYWVSRDTKYSRIGVFRRTCHIGASIPGWYWVSRDTKYSRIGVFRRTCHIGASIPGWYWVSRDTKYSRIGVFRRTCHIGASIPGWYWVSRDTKYSRIGVFRRTCHLGASQDGTGYPGILSIQGLGCSGGHAIWGIPGWYWVSQDTKYSRIGVFRRTCICHLETSQDGTGYPRILSIQGLGCSGGHAYAIWKHLRMVLGIPGY